jgi:hypothetical protein
MATATATVRPAPLKRSRDQQHDRWSDNVSSVKRAATRPAAEQAEANRFPTPSERSPSPTLVSTTPAVADGSAARLLESRFAESLASPTPLQPEANGYSLPPPFPPSFSAIAPTALSSSTTASAAIAAVPSPSAGPVTVPDQYRRGDLVAAVDNTDEVLDSDSDPSGIDDSDDEDNDDNDDNDGDALPPAKRARREPTTSDTDPANPTETGGGRRRRSPGYVVCRLAESVESLLPDDYRALVKVSSHVRDGVWRFGGSKNGLVLKSSLLCRLHPVPAKTTTAATKAMVDTIAPGREEGAEVVRLSASTRSLVAQLLADRQPTSS